MKQNKHDAILRILGDTLVDMSANGHNAAAALKIVMERDDFLVQTFHLTFETLFTVVVKAVRLSY